MSEQRSILEWTRDIWKRPLDILPVHKDFPRLSSGLEIVDGDTNQIIYKDVKGDNTVTVCRDILWHLAALLPDQIDKDYKKRNRKELIRTKEIKKKKKRNNFRELDEYSEREISLDDSDEEESDLNCSQVNNVELEQKEEEEREILPLKFSGTVVQSQTKTKVELKKIYTENIFANIIRDKYTLLFDDSVGDLSLPMEKLFKAGLFDTEGKFSKVLKCIQQEILCPAVMDLRSRIYSHHRYKDIKGTWFVRIEFYYDNQLLLLQSPTLPENLINSINNINADHPLHPKKVKSTPDTSTKYKDEKKGRIHRSKNMILNRSSSASAFEATSPRRSSSPSLRKSILDSSQHSSHSNLPIYHQIINNNINNNINNMKNNNNNNNLNKNNNDDEDDNYYNYNNNDNNNNNNNNNNINNNNKSYISSSLKLKELSSKTLKNIRIIHRKREQSHDDDPSFHFEFEWEMSLEFDPFLIELLNVKIEITDLLFSDGVSKEKREELLNLFSCYISQTFPFTLIWKKPAAKSALHKEIPLITKSLKIIDLRSRVVYEPSNIYNLIVALSRCVLEEPEILKRIDSKMVQILMSKIESSSHISKSLKQFLTLLVEEENQFVRILKATAKDFISPAYSQVKKLLKNSAKDFKEISWNVSVQFFTHVIIITHNYSNSCNLFNSNNDQTLELEWVLMLTFDINVQQILSAKLEIVKYTFLGDIPLDKRQIVLDSIQSVLTSETRESSKITIPISKVLNCLAEKLKILNEEDLMISNLLCDSKISAIDLLHYLEETLRTANLTRITKTNYNY